MERKEEEHASVHSKKSYKSLTIKSMRRWCIGKEILKGWVFSCCSVAQSCLTLRHPVDGSTPGLPVPHHLPKAAQAPVHCIGDPAVSSSVTHFSSCPQSFPASGSFPVSQFFASGGQTTGASASAAVLTTSIYSLISLRIDWLDLHAVQWSFRSLLHHHSSKAPILWCSAFFMVQLSHPYMTTEKTMALAIRIFAGRGMSLLFNRLSRWVIASLPESNRLLISWLHSPSAVILELKKKKSFPLLFTMKSWGQMPWS